MEMVLERLSKWSLREMELLFVLPLIPLKTAPIIAIMIKAMPTPIMILKAREDKKLEGDFLAGRVVAEIWSR